MLVNNILYFAKLNDMKSLSEYLVEAYNFRTLTEDIESVLRLFPNIEKEKAMQLIALDPTYKEGRNSVGTYGKWILNLFNQKRIKDEDLYKVTEYLKEFEQKKKWFTNRDIQQFKTLPDLRKALDEVEVGELSKNQKQKEFHKEIKQTDLDAQKIFEDAEWVCYIPNTYEASCKLSTNTEWCTGISSKGNTYNYDWYTSRGPLYILHNKKNPDEKYQLHFETDSYMDKYDSPIEDLQDFFNMLPKELGDKFKDLEIKKYWKDLTPDDVHSNILTHTLRKYFMEYIEDSDISHGSHYMSGKSIAAIIEDPWSALEYYGEDLDLDYFTSDQLCNTNPRVRDYLKDLGIMDEETFFKLIKDELNKERYNSYSHYDEDILKAVRMAAQGAFRDGCIEEALSDIEKAIVECFPKEFQDKLKVNLSDHEISLTLDEDGWKDFIQKGIEIKREDTYYYEDIDSIDSMMGYYLIDGLKVSEPYSGWTGFDQNNYVDYLADELSEIVDEREEKIGHQMDLFNDYDENGEPKE